MRYLKQSNLWWPGARQREKWELFNEYKVSGMQDEKVLPQLTISYCIFRNLLKRQISCYVLFPSIKNKFNKKVNSDLNTAKEF